MFAAWITLSLLLPGVGSFLIHNKLHSRCLEDSATHGPVLLRTCNLDTDLQQWVWRDQSILECVATSRCLSAHHTDPVRTVSCEGQGDGGDGLLWDCDRGRLISQNGSLELSADGGRLALSRHGAHSQWRSLDEGDICQSGLRSKRASSGTDEFEVKGEGEKKAGPAAMTPEQREFLRWYYRTEDPTPWLFAMLGLSFACLLVGFLLLGLGSMASKSRRKIAKYKAVAAMARSPEAEALQVITEVNEHTETSFSTPTPARSPVTRQVEGTKQTNGDAEGLRPGDIMVTWKNGDVSTLYSEPAPEPEEEEEEEEEEREEEEEGEKEEEEGGKGEEEGGKEEEEGEKEEEGVEEVLVAAAGVEVQTGGAPEE